MTMHPLVPAWARDFNNERRHCWPGRESGVRIMDGSAPEYDPDKEYPVICRIEHDPKLTGSVEWLRFVREFGGLVVGSVPNPFTSDDGRHFLLNETDGHPTSDGRHTYCETYLRSTDSGTPWGLAPVFRVFLDNEAGWARIECYDHEFVGLCELALGRVEASYGMEVTR